VTRHASESAACAKQAAEQRRILEELSARVEARAAELSALQARSRRISTLLHELLDSDAHVKDMCLTHHRLVPKPTSDEGFAVGESGSAEGEAVDVMAAEAKAAAVLDSQELIETLLDVYDA
jgi:hypothetical protein